MIRIDAGEKAMVRWCGPARWLTMVFCISALFLSFGPARAEQPREYRVGYTMLEMDANDIEGNKVRVDVPVWYPSVTPERPFEYDYSDNKVSTVLAVDGRPAEGRFPLIVYSHGATGCGLTMAFLTERLAREGFVVAAPDYKDRYNVCRSKGAAPRLGLTDRVGALVWLRHMRKVGLNKGGKAYRQKLAYRPREASAVIDLLLGENRNSGSRFAGMIDEGRIGMVGHSFGAWTSMLVGGADPAFQDPRVKAIVPLSGPVNEGVYERGEAGNIRIPVMFMFGGDEPAAGRGSDRTLLYDRANPPRFLVEIRGAGHFTFSGGTRKEFPAISDYVEKDPRRAAIVDYTAAFLKYYLKDDMRAGKRLTEKSDALASYAADFGGDSALKAE